MLDKLSFSLRHNLARQHSAVKWTLDDLRKVLRLEIEVLEDGVEHSFTKPKKSNEMFTGSTIYKKNIHKRRCAYCTRDHWLTNCKEAVTVEERFKIARVKKLCFNCLSSSHSSSNDCPSKKRCHTCQCAYHTSLHFNNIGSVDSKGPFSKPRTETTAPATSVSPATLTVTTTHPSGHSNFFVFLETERAMVQSQGVKTKGNVLIDKGA